MRLPKKDQKGFTLVELLIVLAILAVLAAVVIPNVTGMFGRGAQQSYSTDLKTMQTAVATFYFDSHYGPNTDGTTGWDGTDTTKLHNYPTSTGEAPSDVEVQAVAVTGTGAYDGYTFYAVHDAGGLMDAAADVLPAAIWCGLLVNTPGLTTADADDPGGCAPVDDEDGPYLNEFPQSSSTTYNGNPDTTGGTYTWIVAANGTVFGVSFIDPDGSGAVVEGWYAGFNGSYP